MRPAYVKNSRETCLIPVGAESNKEVQVLSAFMATLPVIEGWLAAAFGNALPVRVGKQTKIKCYTEIEFVDPDFKGCRPDGLIIVSSGRSEWTALVEAKVKHGKLEQSQIEKYAQAAKKYGIDGLITISNEMASRPDHHPISLPKTLTNKVALLHFSWASILTNAQILKGQTAVEDPEQSFILQELIKYLNHESSGIYRFDQMSSAWTEIVKQAVGLLPFAKSSEEVSQIASDWIQESKDLSMRLSSLVNERVEVKHSRSAKADLAVLRKEIIDGLANRHALETELDVPNSAGAIKVIANLQTRQISVSMQLVAPKDKKSTSARVNWLLRMLKDEASNDLVIGATWPSRIENTHATVAQLREEPISLQCANPKVAPVTFVVYLMVDNIKAFNGRKTFIALLEESVESFYTVAGQHIKAWQAAPPKAKTNVDEVVDADATDRPQYS